MDSEGFLRLRRSMVDRYRLQRYVQSQRVADAMLRVPREEFMTPEHRDYAYADSPAPIPGDGRQTISAPYMYPVTYEPLELKPGDRILEVGAGSGYGAALAWELVKPTGLVVAVEINPVTHSFAEANLERTGYGAVKLILGDGGLGYTGAAPYDAISITASSPDFPPPLLGQLRSPGRMIAPIGSPYYGQDLVLLEKDAEGKTRQRTVMQVVYVPLVGEHGWSPR